MKECSLFVVPTFPSQTSPKSADSQTWTLRILTLLTDFRILAKSHLEDRVKLDHSIRFRGRSLNPTLSVLTSSRAEASSLSIFDQWRHSHESFSEPDLKWRTFKKVFAGDTSQKSGRWRGGKLTVDTKLTEAKHFFGLHSQAGSISIITQNIGWRKGIVVSEEVISLAPTHKGSFFNAAITAQNRELSTDLCKLCFSDCDVLDTKLLDSTIEQ